VGVPFTTSRFEGDAGPLRDSKAEASSILGRELLSGLVTRSRAEWRETGDRGSMVNVKRVIFGTGSGSGRCSA
jgi:hypothetical protein